MFWYSFQHSFFVESSAKGSLKAEKLLAEVLRTQAGESLKIKFTLIMLRKKYKSYTVFCLQ